MPPFSRLVVSVSVSLNKYESVFRVPFDCPRNRTGLSLHKREGCSGMTMNLARYEEFKDNLTAENSERSILNTSSAIILSRI